MFQLTDTALALGRELIIQTLRNSIDNLNGKISGLVKAELWDNNISGSHDIALYCEFENISDILYFQNHELHLAHKNLAKDWVKNRVFLDYQE